MGEIDDVETQLRQEFGHLAGTITVPAAPGVAGVSVRPHRRWVLPATVAAAVLLLLVGVTVAIGHRHGPTQPTDGVPRPVVKRIMWAPATVMAVHETPSFPGALTSATPPRPGVAGWP